jgi:hypothetical protein
LDSLTFERACAEIIGQPRERNGIGTLSEKTLHAVLKKCYEENEENHEVKIGDYVADIVGEKGIIEIQTGNFTQLRPKLEVLLDYTDVTVVYPMAAVKYIAWLDPETGEVTQRRRSPKKVKPCEAFYELIRIKYLLDNPRFHLKIVMLEITETRWLNGYSEDGKRGSQRCDRIPEGLVREIDIYSPKDYDCFLPEGLGEQFTIKDLARRSRVHYDAAQKTISALAYLGRIELCGKKGKTNLYRRCNDN